MKRLSRYTPLVLLTVTAGLFTLAAPVQAMDETSADAKMTEMMKWAQPGEGHQKLQPFVGKWRHTGTYKMTATAKPETIKGMNLNKWIMDGRYLQQQVKGNTLEGKPQFRGLGYIGYDNMKKSYTSVWLDNMGTSIMTSTATFNTSDKTFEESGTMACPVTGDKNRPFRAQWTLKNSNLYTYKVIMKDKESGKEFTSMEIEYTRVK